jgi:hypothetical protein
MYSSVGFYFIEYDEFGLIIQLYGGEALRFVGENTNKGGKFATLSTLKPFEESENFCTRIEDVVIIPGFFEHRGIFHCLRQAIR